MATKLQFFPTESAPGVPASQPHLPRSLTLRKVRRACSRERHAAAGPAISTDEAERNQKIVELLPLLHRIARTMRSHFPAHVQVDDLVSAGTLGLVDAVRKFDARKGVKIESYAQHRIRGAILDSLRSMDGASRDLRLKSRRAEEACRELESRLGRPAGDLEMADAQGLSLQKWYRTVEEIKPLGLEWLRPMGVAGFKPVMQETLADDGAPNQWDLCYRREQKDLLERALACLTRRDRTVITLYYFRERSMKQIAVQLGIDESRVSQVHAAAVARLRNVVRAFLKNRN